MIDNKKAEAICRKLTESYIAECLCDDEADVVKCLSKLISMCGMGICAVTDRHVMDDTFKDVALYLFNKYPDKFKKEAIQ